MAFDETRNSGDIAFASFPPVESKSGPEDDAWMRNWFAQGHAQIAVGTFRMGSDAHYSEERPAHSVS